MRCIKLTLAYDGTAYEGWQCQRDRTTLQGTLEAALLRITGSPTRTLASGRTDGGVHALGQVVAFRTECRLAPDILRKAINAHLPRDMAVLAAVEVPLSFHPIRDALRKRYRYQIHDGPRDVFRRHYVWHVPQRLNVAAMHAAAAVLLGRHDFASFQTSGAPRKTTVRTIFDIHLERGLEPQQDLVILEVQADGFLYNMVRAIVGSLYEVGRGARDQAWFESVLAAADRRRAGRTAPPQGLFLVDVDYEPLPEPSQSRRAARQD